MDKMEGLLENLNKEQLAAVKAVDGPVMVFAGAGTGKTRALTARIAYMIQEKNIMPYNILAITFTKKATNEMRERVIKLSGINAKYVTISTIHAFCARILRQTISKLGYSLNFEIVDGKVTNVSFVGGCSGNLQGISQLVEGMDVEDAIRRMEGIKCGFKSTSCPDQLAKGLKKAAGK
mgnify:CR=1 FL=1